MRSPPPHSPSPSFLMTTDRDGGCGSVSAEWINGILHLSITQPTDRPSPFPTPLQTPIASTVGSPKLRGPSGVGMSTIPDAAAFAKKALGGAMTPVGDANPDINGAEGVKGMTGF